MTENSEIKKEVTQEKTSKSTTSDSKQVASNPKTSSDSKPSIPSSKPKEFRRDNNRPRRNNRKNFNRETDQYEEKVIQIKRVIKVTKGGRKFKFSALVVVGDKKGHVGFATAKSIEVPEAIKKAARLARKNIYSVKIVGDHKTIPHEYIGHNGAARVLLKPAKDGKGIVASDVVRSVVELAGIENIYSKNLGSNTPKAVVLGTIDALVSMKTKEQFEKLRDKKL